MHFAYPPRKNSNPAAFRPRQSRIPIMRRSRLRSIALLGIVIVGSLWILSKLFGSVRAPTWEPSGNPPVVLVTVLDEKTHGAKHTQSIKDNREQYAIRHGYGIVFAHTDDYPEIEETQTPTSWARIVAMRHALTKYPNCRYAWYLDQDAYIMDPTTSLEDRVMRPATLGELMVRSFPVVKGSIIKTFSYLQPRDVAFVLTQDSNSLSSGSFVVRNHEWARFLLETWFDPLYRSYKFQRAEEHALEHMVQWHPTILSKLALVPQRSLSSYAGETGDAGYQEGDFVVRAPGCGQEGERSCDEELSKYRTKWQQAFEEA